MSNADDRHRMPPARQPDAALPRLPAAPGAAPRDRLTSETSLDDLFTAILGERRHERDDRSWLLDTVDAQVRTLRAELGLPEPSAEPQSAAALVDPIAVPAAVAALTARRPLIDVTARRSRPWRGRWRRAGDLLRQWSRRMRLMIGRRVTSLWMVALAAGGGGLDAMP